MFTIQSERSPLVGTVPRFTLAIVILFNATLAAHDLWIEPATFSPQSGQLVGVSLRVGQDFVGDPVPRDPSLISQFIVEDAAGRKPIAGRNGADPAGFLRVVTPGLLVIGYRSKPNLVVLDGAKFSQYLKEEGLEKIAAIRARRNETGASAREVFTRCAKSLVLSGPSSKAQDDRPLGFTLELVAERNPYAIRAGQDLPVRLTYENRPLAGALMVAMNRLNPSEKLSARTDSNGRVRFRLRRSGTWLIKAVHLVPAPPDANAEWASFWASLTFEMPGSNNTAVKR